METSFANGGQLSASNAEVWNHSSTLLKGLKWMFTRDAPLLVNPRPSWHKLSWFAEFIAAIPDYRANTVETTRLAIAAREHLFAWAEEDTSTSTSSGKASSISTGTRQASTMRPPSPGCWRKAACNAAPSLRRDARHRTDAGR